MTADRIERKAGAGLTAIAFDFEPTQPAVEALWLATAAPGRRILPFAMTKHGPRHGRLRGWLVGFFPGAFGVHRRKYLEDCVTLP